MKVHIQVEGWQYRDDLPFVAGLVEEIFAACADVVGVPVEALDEVWIADDAEYGKVISRIDPDEGYSHGVYEGVGKTIGKTRADGSVGNAVVLRHYLIFPVLQALINRQPFDDWGVALQRGMELIYHEVGHCKDNYIRRDNVSVPLKQGRWFKVEEEAKRYIPILAGEFAACVHAAKGMTVEVYRSEIDSTYSTIMALLQDLEIRKRSSAGNEQKSVRLALDAPGVFWLALIQYAKLVASRLGNPHLSTIPLSSGQDRIAMVGALLSEFANWLTTLWDTYPDWEYSSFDFALELWKALAFEYGFMFREGAEADGVYWESLE